MGLNRNCRQTTGLRCLVALIIWAGSFVPVTAGAQQSSTGAPDITGSWERARDASIPAQPQPPLKPQYLKEWQAKIQAVREANAKG